MVSCIHLLLMYLIKFTATSLLPLLSPYTVCAVVSVSIGLSDEKTNVRYRFHVTVVITAPETICKNMNYDVLHGFLL